MNLVVVDGAYAVCRLAPTEPVPGWAWDGMFCAVTRTPEELSIVVRQDAVPEGVTAEHDWCLLKVEGVLDFGLVGILASLTEPLAQACISLFALSTYDTDYIMVKSATFEAAVAALQAAGHEVRRNVI